MTRGQYIALCVALTASLAAFFLANRVAQAVTAMRNGTPLNPSKTILM